MSKKPAKSTKSYVEYDSNNSGSRWWLKDEDWIALEKAGWKVKWARLDYLYNDEGGYVYAKDGTPKLVPHGTGGSKYPSFLGEDGRYLGALADKAWKPGATSLRKAAAEWEDITGQCATDAGCACCGQPHRFTLNRDGKDIESGPNAAYTASW
jgi:hypothetical protein